VNQQTPAPAAPRLPTPILADRVQIGPMRTHFSRTTILLLTGCLALMMTGFGIVMPVFARRLGELGGGVAALGWMTMAFAGAQFLAAPLMGALADRVGRRPPILLALAAFTLANLGYLFAPTIPFFIVLRALTGALTAGLSPAAMSIVADTAPAAERGRWIGILMGGYSAGLIFGPVVGGVLYDRWGFAAPFAISAGMGALALVAAVLVVPETRTSAVRLRETLYQRWEAANPGHGTPAQETVWSSLPQPLSIFLVLLAVDFIGTFAFTFVEPQMVFYVYDKLGWSTAQFGLVVAAYGVAMFLGQTTLGQLSDRVGRRPVIVVGVLLNSMLYAGLAFLTNFAVIIVVSAVAGLGAALSAPALSASLFDITADKHRSRVMGIKNAALSLGGVLGPFLVVFATQLTTPRGVFLIAGGLVLLGGLLALLLLRPAQSGYQAQRSQQYSQDPQRIAAAHAVLHGLVIEAAGARARQRSPARP